MTGAAAVALLGAGVVAVFVSSNSSGTAALLTLGTALLVIAIVGDRLLKAKVSGVEIELATKVKDHLRSAFDKRLRGNYEAAEDEIREAFERFTQQLDGEQSRQYAVSKAYNDEVRRKLEHIVHDRFAGSVQSTTATSSFFPLIDVVLNLDGRRVRAALDARHLALCPDLDEHLDQQLRVGVTIRPGPELDPNRLVDRLRADVQDGAVSATCFLLIQNCTGSRSATAFRHLARQLGMHATSVEWSSGGSEPELDAAIDEAILTICSEAPGLAPAVRLAN